MTEAIPRWIILSPHLDDGALSCGGLIAALSPHFPVEVWTIFGGAPWRGPYSGIAHWLHGVSGGATGSRLARIRRKEDRVACGMLGVRWKHFRWHDAAYRRCRDKKFLYQSSCQDSWENDDKPMVRELIKTMHKHLRVEDRVLVPLAIGRHVDHIIVRHVAEQTNHPGLIYYPDIPYKQRFPEEAEIQSAGMKVLEYGVSKSQATYWVQAVKAYCSQMGMLEEAVGSLEALIMSYAASGKTPLFVDGNGSLALEAMACDLKSVGLSVSANDGLSIPSI